MVYIFGTPFQERFSFHLLLNILLKILCFTNYILLLASHFAFSHDKMKRIKHYFFDVDLSVWANLSQRFFFKKSLYYIKKCVKCSKCLLLKLLMITNIVINLQIKYQENASFSTNKLVIWALSGFIYFLCFIGFCSCSFQFFILSLTILHFSLNTM